MGGASGDGRNIDPGIGLLAGEGADQRVPEQRANTQGSAPFEVWNPASAERGRRDEPTYYDRPVLKEPTWIWSVPAYFYAGGAAGAAAVLGAAARALGGEDSRGLVTRCRWIAAAGGAIGTAGLVYDLGRPERFLNMLRVFRVSSPMNIGSWVLAASAPLAAGSAVLSGSGGVLGVSGDLAGYGVGLLGMPLAGYTGVLLANTANPVWQGAGRSLPGLFIASGMSAAAALLQTMRLAPNEIRIVRRFAIVAALAEVAAHVAMQREAGRVDRVATPLREGPSGALLKAARACGVASLLVTLAPGTSRPRRILAGALGTAGALALKFGVFEAGKASARDPRATFQQQRARQAAAGTEER
jgi:hypothetical protein